MNLPIAQARKANKYTDRRCEACQRQTDGISSLCRLHLHRRSRLGSVRVTRQLRHKEYAYLVGVATKYLKKNPPSSNVLESMQRFLQPPGMTRPITRKQALLITEMSRWSDARYRNRWTDHGGYRRKANYTSTGILAVLIAVKAYVEERDGVGFPHDSEDYAMMFALTRLWRRPRGYSNGKKGRLAPIRYSTKVSKTVLTSLVKQWREYSMVGVYVLQTARVILAELKANEAKRNAALPRSYTQEEMKRMYEAQQAKKREREAAEPKARRIVITAADLFGREDEPKAPPPPEAEPFDPGPRPINDGSAPAAAAIMAWAKKWDRWQKHLREKVTT
jgi:hypothetical protein